jgi:hypothetical protein
VGWHYPCADLDFAREVGIVSRSWVVIYIDDALFDEWRVFETLPHAQQFYDECVESGAETVSLCAVVQSTDYEPHELFREGE